MVDYSGTIAAAGQRYAQATDRFVAQIQRGDVGAAKVTLEEMRALAAEVGRLSDAMIAAWKVRRDETAETMAKQLAHGERALAAARRAS